jgi:hypothetical protein
MCVTLDNKNAIKSRARSVILWPFYANKWQGKYDKMQLPNPKHIKFLHKSKDGDLKSKISLTLSYNIF